MTDMMKQSNNPTNLPGIPKQLAIGQIATYRYDIAEEAEAKAYKDMCDTLKSQGYKLHRSWGFKGTHYGIGCQVRDSGVDVLEVDMAHLFNNQWNLVDPNVRVHEWAEDAMVGDMRKTMRKGYFLMGLEPLRDILRRVNTCRYCGNKGLVGYSVTCTACLGSPYLKESDLRLLVMAPILGDKVPDETIDMLLPDLKKAWKEQQLMPVLPKHQEQAVKRATEEAKECRTKAERYSRAAACWDWMAEQGISTENVIYYSHSDTFGIGWRSGLDEGLRDLWTEKLKDFPGTYKFDDKKG